jgi:hypothetical protein
MLPSTLKYLYSVEPDRMHFPAKQPCALLHSGNMHSDWFNGTERYFRVDGSMEKKWDTVIPADLKRLVKWGIYVPLVTKVLRPVFTTCKAQFHTAFLSHQHCS